MRTARIMSILVLVLSVVGSATANWVTSGDDIYADIMGNVGIGTSSPTEKLTVIGSDSEPGDRGIYGYGSTGIYGEGYYQSILGPESGTGVVGKGFSTGVRGIAGGSSGKGISGLASGEEGYGVYGEASDGNDVENYGGYFKANGRSGIGVYGHANYTGDDRRGANNYGGYFVGEGPYRKIMGSGPTGIGIYARGNSWAGYFEGPIRIDGNASITGRVSVDGNVGIDMFPTRKLSVNGRIGLTDVRVWDGTDDNDLTWDGFTISREGSSRRYKQNIHPFEEDFHKILKLEAKQFQMREGYGNPEKDLFGYIAEELEEVGLAKLVTHDAEGRPDGIKYKKLAIYLNEIVKEHNQDIAELKNEIGKRVLPSVAEGNVTVTPSPESKLAVTESIYIEQLHERISILEEKLAKLEAGMNTR
ncbi:tail fiber domain-containing protein [Planctomycetota bacterium]